MPTINLPTGPVRVHVRNQSGDKVITGVKVGVRKGAAINGMVAAVPQPVVIQPNQQEEIFNEAQTDDTDAVCIELDILGVGACSWSGDYTGEAPQGVARVLLVFLDCGNMDMKVWPMPVGTPMIPNLIQGPDCAGEYPGE